MGPKALGFGCGGVAARARGAVGGAREAGELLRAERAAGRQRAGAAPHAPHDHVDQLGEEALLAAQHLAAVVVRSHRDAGLTVRDLASRTGASEDYLSGQLNGRYPAGLDDLARWAVALHDPSVLPVFDDLEGLHPPR